VFSCSLCLHFLGLHRSLHRPCRTTDPLAGTERNTAHGPAARPVYVIFGSAETDTRQMHPSDSEANYVWTYLLQMRRAMQFVHPQAEAEQQNTRKARTDTSLGPGNASRQKNTARARAHPDARRRESLPPPGAGARLPVVLSSSSSHHAPDRSAPPKQHGRTRARAGNQSRTRARTATLPEKSPHLPVPASLPLSPPLLKHPRADGSPPRPLGLRRDRGWAGGWGSSGGGRCCGSSPSLPRPSPSPSPWKPTRATLIRSTGARSPHPASSAAYLRTLLGLAASLPLRSHGRPFPSIPNPISSYIRDRYSPNLGRLTSQSDET
jgi:hypothetical protein